MALLEIFANTILPVLIIAGLGFVLTRYMNANAATLAAIVFNVLSPALIFYTLVTSTVSLAEFGRMSLFAFVLILTAGLLAWIFSFSLRLDRTMTTAFVIVAMFANTGNYGLPMTLFAFGPEAMDRATIYFIIHVILLYSLGLVLASAGQAGVRQALWRVARVPHMYAIAVAGLLLYTGTTLPPALMRPIALLNDGALPMMIMLMGMQLGRATLPERPVLVGLATALKLVIMPLLALGLTFIFGLKGADRQAAVMQAAMPAAVMVTVLSMQFQVAPAFTTAVVFLTTVLSPVTLTPIILWLQR
jgi:malate permease and related proteins